MKKFLSAALALLISTSAVALPTPATYMQHAVVNDLGTSAAVITDGNKGLSSSVTTLAELAFVHGATSNLQTQISTKVDTMAAVGSSATANAAVISGTTLTLEPAGATAPGVVTTGTQTIAGAKTFSGAVTATVTGTASGNTTYAANNHGVVVSGSGNSMTVIAPDSSTTKVLTSGGASADPVWAAAAGGGSGINYLTGDNSTIEATVGSWAAYADAAGATPVDATGGSPTTTCTRTTSTPLRGSGSLLLTKDAANRQGEGCSDAITIDVADEAKPIAVSFDYTVASGTYADADLTVYLYDVTNAVVIQPAPYKILNATTGLPERWIGYFQTASNSTSYRVAIHAASTSASAYTVKLDNIVIGPTYQPYGAVVTDWQSYIPTMTNFGTATGKLFYYRRVGDSLQVDGYFVAGTGSSSAGKISLPTGLSIGSQITGDSKQIVGTWTLDTASGTPAVFGNNQGPMIINLGDTATNIYFGSKGVSATVQVQTGDFFNSGDAMSLRFTVPISGWSSNVQVSSDADTRVVAATYTNNGGQSLTGNTTDITWSTKVQDTHSAWSGTQFTAPVPGYYQISGYVRTTAGVGENFYAYVNGSQNIRLDADSGTPSIHPLNSGLLKLNAGDTLSVRADSNATLSNDTSSHWIAINKLSGPAQIAASEKVYLNYTGNAGTSITANSTNVDWSTKVQDSHGAWSGTVFTAPRLGWYSFMAGANITSGTATSLDVYKNGSKIEGSVGTGSSTQHPAMWAGYLSSGDTVSFRYANNVTLSNSSTLHWLSIWSQ